MENRRIYLRQPDKKETAKKILDKSVPNLGGLSGKALNNLSDKMIKYIYQKTKGKFIIMGVGGIFRAEDAYKK